MKKQTKKNIDIVLQTIILIGAGIIVLGVTLRVLGFI